MVREIQMRRGCSIAASIVISAGVLPAPATAQTFPTTDRPPTAMTEATALRLAMEQLTAEGRDFARTGTLVRHRCDFAESFEHRLDPRDVVDAVVKVRDEENPVVDAYLRWQMLSFRPDLASLDAEMMKALAEHLPGLTANPAGEERMQKEFERLAERAARNEAERTELGEQWEAMRVRMKAVELLNVPSERFREAIAEAMPETGQKRALVLLHDLADRIEAGQDTRGIKTRITNELQERKDDPTISLEQRWELIQFVEGMAETVGSRKVIRDVTIPAAGAGEIHYSTLSIRGGDVAKWTAYLNRHEP